MLAAIPLAFINSNMYIQNQQKHNSSSSVWKNIKNLDSTADSLKSEKDVDAFKAVFITIQHNWNGKKENVQQYKIISYSVLMF